ncbi:MAG: AMP-binding protein [Pyrinomonadaceae bacterium]
MTFANLRQLLETRAADTPDKPFLLSETDGRDWTYAEFDRVVNRTANMILSHGIEKGDVVSLLMPNSPEYVAAYFACWEIGAVAGPVNSLLKSEEIEWVVANSESRLLLLGDKGGNTTVRECVQGVPALDFSNLETATSDFPDTLAETALTTKDEAIIIYTSGTTGKPKGCLLTHGNLLANAEQITNWMGFGSDDRLLTIMPLFHMNAVTVTTMTALFCGGSTVVSPKFSASRFWDIVEKYQITSFGSVATMLSMLLVSPEAGVMSIKHEEDRSTSGLKTPDSKLQTLKFAMCGSAPVPAEILKRFEETFGVLVIEGYGLSESTCRSTFNPPNENRRPGSCGQPIGNEMAVLDDDDSEVPDGELGEIALRGPNIFKAYFKNPEATEKAFANGWFHTGDIGYRDADGFFYIADRKSDMIIRGGENIYPREIDDLLYTHPAVAHAAVIGVPDELYGEEVAAFIVLKNGYTGVSSPHEARADQTPPLMSVPPALVGGSSQQIDPTDRRPSIREHGLENSEIPNPKSQIRNVTPDDVTTFCKLHLADYKCPKTVHFVDDIPKGPTGKLLKRELAKRFAEART